MTGVIPLKTQQKNPVLSRKTVRTLIWLLLNEQSDQGPHFHSIYIFWKHYYMVSGVRISTLITVPYLSNSLQLELASISAAGKLTAVEVHGPGTSKGK